MELYYLLVQKCLWTVQLIITFLITTEGMHSYRRNSDRSVHAAAAPEILSDPQNVTVHSNERVVLKCTVRNRRTRDVQWRLVHEKYPLSIGRETWTPDKDISVFYTKYNDTDEGWDLVIKQAKPRHTNIYECQISTVKSHIRYVYLKVLDRPVQKVPAVQLTGTAYVDINHKINLTCNATGIIRAPEDVDWFHDGNIIDPHSERWGERLSIYKHIPQIPGQWLISELIIEKSLLEDQGIYVCRSTESEANSFHVTILDNGVPPKTKRNGLDEMRTESNRATLFTVDIVLLLALIVILNS